MTQFLNKNRAIFNEFSFSAINADLQKNEFILAQRCLMLQNSAAMV